MHFHFSFHVGYIFVMFYYYDSRLNNLLVCLYWNTFNLEYIVVYLSYGVFTLTYSMWVLLLLINLSLQRFLVVYMWSYCLLDASYVLWSFFSFWCCQRRRSYAIKNIAYFAYTKGEMHIFRVDMIKDYKYVVRFAIIKNGE